MARNAGRGVLIPQEILDAPLRRPMRPPAGSKYDSIFSDQKPTDELTVFHVLKTNFFDAITPDNTQAMVEHIISSGLNNPINAAAICKYLFIFSKDEVRGPKILSAFWNRMEILFKERTKMLDHSRYRFRNYVKWFAAAVRHNRDVHHPPAAVLLEGLATLSMDLNPVEEIEESQLYALLAIHYCQYTSRDKSDEIDKIKETFRETLRSCLFRENAYPKNYHVWLTLALESTYTPHLSQRSERNYVLSGIDPLFFSPSSFYTTLPASEKGNYRVEHIEDVIKYV